MNESLKMLGPNLPARKVPELPVRLLALTAHPDDAEFAAGGLITSHRRLGNLVKIVSVTNGAAGHHLRSPAELISLRRTEAAEVARMTGVIYDVWDFPDGELQPTLEVRRRIIREIREFAPDLVLTHRPCDYHPDHRALGLAVQDASFMVTVPHIVPEVPALRRDPVVAYTHDLFTRPYPMTPDVVRDVTRFADQIVAMLACHRSQVFEWLPYNAGREIPPPHDEKTARQLLREWYEQRAQAIADQFRPKLVARYGVEQGQQVRMAEAFEISEYARRPAENEWMRFFPE